MKISVTRSGGYAGLEETATVDTDHADPAVSSEIEELARNAAIFDISQEDLGEEPIGADLARYEISVHEGGRHRVIAFQDDGSPAKAPLRTLAERIITIGSGE